MKRIVFIFLAIILASSLMLSSCSIGDMIIIPGGNGTNDTKPGEDDTKPGEDDTKPGEDNTNPGEDNTKPDEDDTKPGEDNTKPGEDDTKPGEDDTKPGEDDTKPGEDDTKPGEDDTNPGEDDTKPGEDDTNPGEDDTNPGEDDTKPGEDDTKPGEDDTKPGEDDTNPGEDNTKPDEDKRGNTVGDLCYNAEVELVYGNGDTVKLDDLRGKAVVVNFWGTWCPPCKAELPHFDQLASEYKDDVTFLAIHTDYQKAAVYNYVSTNFPNSEIIFAYDILIDENDESSADKYFSLLGGTMYYPRTLVLDKNGIITFADDGMLTYDALKAEIDNALGVGSDL